MRQAFYLLLVVMLIIPGLSPLAAGRGTTQACGQEAIHDAFDSQEAAQLMNESGKATSRVKNTFVTLEDATAFSRLNAENPNGYCVAFTVIIGPEVVSPAELGTVASNSEEIEAEWSARQNLTSGDVHTVVTFTLPPGTNATFAPSDVRVKTLSWTGSAKQKSNDIVSGLKSLWGSDKLEERTYKLHANQTDRVSIDLTKGDGQRIEDWHATYQLDGEEFVLSQDANAPVFYRESEGGETVIVEWNNRDAVVTFVAEPSLVDEAEHSWTAWKSAGPIFKDLWPFALGGFTGNEVST